VGEVKDPEDQDADSIPRGTKAIQGPPCREWLKSSVETTVQHAGVRERFAAGPMPLSSPNCFSLRAADIALHTNCAPSEVLERAVPKISHGCLSGDLRCSGCWHSSVRGHLSPVYLPHERRKYPCRIEEGT
jgi:hypothetical protein